MPMYLWILGENNEKINFSIGNQDADWIKSVVDVVDKDDKSPHVQEFIRNPTRDNMN